MTTLSPSDTAIVVPAPGTFDPLDLTYVAIHRSMRRDAVRLTNAIDGGVSEDRAERIAAWYGRFEATLHHHHVIEDDFLWPLLLEVDPKLAVELCELEQEHTVLTEWLDAVHDALDTWGGAPSGPAWEDARAAASDAAAQLERHVLAHLTREESTVLDTTARWTPEQRGRMDAQLHAHEDKELIPFMAPFVLQSITPEELPELRRQVPRLMFVLNKFVWQRKYDRLTAVLEEV